ncbi:MFS transporter [Methanobacterium congolense]|uniref:Multidrug export protein EmrB n=1 Tax=Methanobacterium congolense TaxID=118062 RepID=A0A1D3L4Y2_9EURY|nr:MFS transporter [Methanobacterium congolense]SCG86691.1 Multidrug export protein EmrB [Methanobacterium congolense]
METSAEDPAHDKLSETTYNNRYIILAIVLTGTFMSLMNSNIVNVALPNITNYFNVSIAQSQWIVTSYFLTVTAMFLIFGKISEYTGKTKLFILGFVIFTLGALFCGFSASLDQLIFFRILQALGASMVFSISTAIIMDVFPDSEKGRALGYQASVIAIGLIIAPSLGGVIVDWLGWTYVFFVNIPIGIVGLVSALKYLKIEEHKSENLNMDWMGSSLFVVLMVALILFMGDLSNGGGVLTLICGSIFVLSLFIFILRESNCKEPLLDLTIFKAKSFIKPAMGLILFFIASNMINIIYPLYFEDVLDWRATEVGLTMMIMAVAMFLISPVSGWIYDKYKFRNLSSLGVLITGLTTLLFAYMLLIGNILGAMISLALIGVGCALFMVPNNTDVMSSLPQKTNVLSSVTATFRNFGAFLGVALATTLTSLSYSSHLGLGLSAGTMMVGIFFGIGGIYLVSAIVVYKS